MENRSGLMVSGVATRATGDAEPLAAIELVKGVAGKRRITLGADKAYDTATFVLECREEKVTPHVAQNIPTTRGSRIDGRTTHHPRYAALDPRAQADRGGLRLGEGDRRARQIRPSGMLLQPCREFRGGVAVGRDQLGEEAAAAQALRRTKGCVSGAHPQKMT